MLRMIPDRLYSCDDHLDLWNLPRDVWEDRLPAALRERGPRVVDSGGMECWIADGAMMGFYGMKMMKDYSAISRAGIDDDGFRAADPTLRLQDMDRDGVYVSVIYGPNLFGLPIADVELKAASLATFEAEPLGPELLPLLGPDNFMWASNYPHPDSTFPHSRDAIAHAFKGLDDAFVTKVTATNCAKLYGFA